MLGKSANAAYRDYKKGHPMPLGFTEWLHREKEKSFSANGEDEGLLLINRNLNDSVQKAINDVVKKGGLKERESGKTVFGINKYVVIGGAVVLAGTIIFFIVKKLKK